MIEEQKTIPINTDQLLQEVQKLHDLGWRLVQVGCTRTADNLELNYSFDKQYSFINLRLVLGLEDPQVPSISGIYLAAFLYENEIHDLFGVKITGIAVDYKGNFYRTTVKWPFKS